MYDNVGIISVNLVTVSALLSTHGSPDGVVEVRREHPEGALFDCREIKVGRSGHPQEVLCRVKARLDRGYHHGPDEGMGASVGQAWRTQ